MEVAGVAKADIVAPVAPLGAGQVRFIRSVAGVFCLDRSVRPGVF